MNKTKIKSRYLEIKYVNAPTEFINASSMLSDGDLIMWWYNKLCTKENREAGFELKSIDWATEQQYVQHSLTLKLTERLNANKN